MHNSCEWKIYLWINEKYYMISKIRHEFWSDLFYDLLKERSTDYVTIKTVLLPYIEQFHAAMALFCIRSQKTQDELRKSTTHGCAPLPPFWSYFIFISYLIYYWTKVQKYRHSFLKNEYRNTFDIYLWSFCFSSYNN